MQRRRPHWEREDLLQVFLLGACAAKTELLDGLKASDFTRSWSTGFAAIEKATQGDTSALDRWLDSELGVIRANGNKVVDAALERFRQDAAFRAAKSVDELGAWMARVKAEMQDRQLRRE